MCGCSTITGDTFRAVLYNIEPSSSAHSLSLHRHITATIKFLWNQSYFLDAQAQPRSCQASVFNPRAWPTDLYGLVISKSLQKWWWWWWSLTSYTATSIPTTKVVFLLLIHKTNKTVRATTLHCFRVRSARDPQLVISCSRLSQQSLPLFWVIHVGLLGLDMLKLTMCMLREWFYIPLILLLFSTIVLRILSIIQKSAGRGRPMRASGSFWPWQFSSNQQSLTFLIPDIAMASFADAFNWTS